jgi:hypothetical protein
MVSISGTKFWEKRGVDQHFSARNPAEAGTGGQGDFGSTFDAF